MSKLRGGRVALALGLSCAAITAACGSSTKSGSPRSSTGGSPSETTAAAAAQSRGGDIKIMALGLFSSPVLSLPDAPAAMSAAVDAANAAGGINGHHIDLTLCNDQNDPNQASSCARQAVSNHDVAVVASYEPFTAQVVPILQQAKLPFFNAEPVVPLDATSSVEFPLTGGVQAEYAALGVALKAAGCSKVGAVVADATSVEQGAEWLGKGIKSRGGTMVESLVGLTQASFSSQIAHLESQGVQCIVPATAPSQGASIVSEVAQSGKKVLVGGISSEFPGQSLTALGSQADGIIIADQEYRPTDDVPAIAMVKAAMAKYQPGTKLTEAFGVLGWAAMSTTLGVIKTGAYTPSAILKAANATQSFDTGGVVAPFSFTSAAPVAQFPRVKNWNYVTWKVEGGTTQLTTSGFQLLTGVG